MNALTDKPKPLSQRPRFSIEAGDRLSENSFTETIERANRRARMRGVRQVVTVYREGSLYPTIRGLHFVLQDKR